jgi:hypothetical protein
MISSEEVDFKIPLTPFVKGGKKGMVPINFVIDRTVPRAVTR